MRLKAFLLIAGAAVLLAMIVLAAGFSASGLAEGPALRKALMTRLVDWRLGDPEGGGVVLRGPVRLTGFPTMAIEAENVEFKRGGRPGAGLGLNVERLRARLRWLDLIMGRPGFSELTLEGAVFQADWPSGADGGGGALAAAIVGPAPEPAEARLSFWLARTAPAPLRLRKGWIAFRGSDRRAHPRMEILDMSLRRGDGGVLEMAGDFAWRRQTYAFTLRKGGPSADHEGLSAAPLRVSVEHRLFRLAADGLLIRDRTGGLRFKGEAKASSADAGGAARQLNLSLPATLTPTVFSASGQLDWKEREIGVERLEASLDALRAAGALSVRLAKADGGQAAPLGLEGTLALSSLDLRALEPGILEPAFLDGSPPATGDGAGFHPALTDLLRWGAVDLRLSVGRLSIGGVAGGSAAVAVLSREARLSVDLADFAVLGGRVRGHFALDASQPSRRVAVRATGEGLDSAELASAAGLPGWLSGGVDLNVEARASGRDQADLLRTLNGEIRAVFAEGGSVGFDLAGLMRREGPDDPGRWSQAGRSATSFDALRGEFVIEQGRLRSKTLELTEDHQAVEGRCVVDLPARTMDWRFALRGETAGREGGAGAAVDAPFAPALVIEGPWGNPRVHLGEAVPDGSRDRPTGGRTLAPIASPNG